jgi:tryptophan 2,3-dioxygenase
MKDAPNYWDYLNLDRLLTLQGGLEGDEASLLPDELHFIVVHQTYELWFKLCSSVRMGARRARPASYVEEETIPVAVHHLRRVTAILRLAVHQIEVMETFTPQGFLDFRDKLVPASGFQSFQMRELEILLGLGGRRAHPLRQRRPGAPHPRDRGEQPGRRARAGAARRGADRADVPRVPRRLAVPDADPGQLARRPGRRGGRGDLRHRVPRADGRGAAGVPRAAAADAGREGPGGDVAAVRGDPRVVAVVPRGLRRGPRAPRAAPADPGGAVLFIESYRDLPLLSWPRLLIDLVVEVRRGWCCSATATSGWWSARSAAAWARAARAASTTSSRRAGTACFRDLWAVRTVLLPRSRVPALRAAELYGFRHP